MLIHSGRDMEFLFHSGDTDYLLVSFGEIAYLADGKNFWGKPMVERRRVNAIGVSARSPNWFPRADVEEFAARHRDLLDRFKGRIVTVGHSMGGYAAIKHSRLLGASTVVVTAPQYTIDRAAIPNDTRQPIPYFRPELHTGMHPKPDEMSGEIYIFCDLQHSGRPQFDAYASLRLPNIHIVNVPSVGHEVSRVFARDDGFLDLVGLCRAGDRAAINRFVRKHRKPLPLRTATVALRAAKRRPDLALRIYDLHKKRFGPIYIAMLSKALTASRPAAADALLLDALALKPDLAGTSFVSSLLASRGRSTEAMALENIIPPV